MISHTAHPTKVDRQILIISKNTNKHMVINCSAMQYIRGVHEYREGAAMQEAFPFLDNEEREFLISGMLPRDWDELFKDILYEETNEEATEISR